VILLFAAVLGLVVGSFLNVVIWRVPRGESIVRPASACPSCATPIRPRDNIPVLSWLLLRGRCRSCRAPIAVRYPIVELATCALFAAIAARFGAHVLLPAFLYLAAVGLTLAVIDLDTHRLPDVLTLPTYVVGLVLLGIGAIVQHEPWSFVRALIGMAAMYGLYLLLALVKPGAMGFGDVKLAGALGLFLGYLGWDVLVVGAFLGFLLGGVVGAAFMAARRATRKSMIPFGPFMIAGALLAVFVGNALAGVYTGVAVH
jgi:leader peptidase (prepilin peptidase)/N-methyltransferase